MKNEELSDFIVKNLAFLLIFIIFCFSITEYLLLPKFQDFQEEKNQLRHTQFFQAKTQKQNGQIQAQIQELKIQNQNILNALQKKVTLAKLQSIAKDFFADPVIVKKEKTTSEGVFTEILFKIEGKSNGTKAIFDFMTKIKTIIPNATLILPLDIEKKDPLVNSLNVSFLVKTTQLKNAE